MAQFHGFDTISIHSPHARGDESLQSYIVRYLISIHSPHARGDGRFIRTGGAWDISIHSPHARGDTAAKRFASIRCYFNPLPSCEGRLHGSTIF